MHIFIQEGLKAAANTLRSFAAEYLPGGKFFGKEISYSLPHNDPCESAFAFLKRYKEKSPHSRADICEGVALLSRNVDFISKFSQRDWEIAKQMAKKDQKDKEKARQEALAREEQRLIALTREKEKRVQRRIETLNIPIVGLNEIHSLTSIAALQQLRSLKFAHGLEINLSKFPTKATRIAKLHSLLLENPHLISKQPVMPRADPLSDFDWGGTIEGDNDTTDDDTDDDFDDD